MKFTLNVVALALGVVVMWTTSVQSSKTIRRRLVLDLMANDKRWREHLNMPIKLKPKTLSAAAKEVLLKLKVLKAISNTTIDPAQEQKPEEEPIQEPEQERDEVVVAKPLHIVADVASYFSEQSMAIDFTLDVIASGIKCNTLMHVLMQLKAIRVMNKLQNDVIKTQPSDVWNSLIRVMDKAAVLKNSIKEELNLFRQWDVVATQYNNKELPSGFEDFEKLIERLLGESCELNKIDDIKKHLKLDQDENWNTVDKTINIFTQMQQSLTKMFDDIPITKMNAEVWKNFVYNPEFIESIDKSDA